MNSKRILNIAYTILLISSLNVISTTGWILTENRNILTVMELLTIWAAVVIIRFMAELYRGTDENQKSHGMMALILSSCMAVVTILNHFIYLTVLRQLYFPGKMPSWLLLDGWPSVTKGLECVAWGFLLGLAMLFVSGALMAFGSKTIVWTMRVGGVLALTGLVGPITGNMNYYILSTIGYSVGFLILSVEFIVYFHKSK